MMERILLLVLPCVLLSVPVARGQQGGGVPALGWADLDTSPSVSASFGFATAGFPQFTYDTPPSRLWGFVPDFNLQFGTDDIAVFLGWGFSVAEGEAQMEDIDAELYPGAIILGLKVRRCFEQEWRICAGGNMRFSVQPFEPDEDEELSMWMLFNTKQGLLSTLWHTFALEPLAVLSASRGDFSVRLAVGPSLSIFWEDEEKLFPEDTAEVALLYSLEGEVAIDWVRVSAGLRGLSMLSLTPLYSSLMVSFGASARLGRVSPFLRFSIPANVWYSGVVIISFGMGAEF